MGGISSLHRYDKSITTISDFGAKAASELRRRFIGCGFRWEQCRSAFLRIYSGIKKYEGRTYEEMVSFRTSKETPEAQIVVVQPQRYGQN